MYNVCTFPKIEFHNIPLTAAKTSTLTDIGYRTIYPCKVETGVEKREKEEREEKTNPRLEIVKTDETKNMTRERLIE